MKSHAQRKPKSAPAAGLSSRTQRSAVRPQGWAAQSAAPLALPVQRKMEISQPGDPFEREANHVAERVVSGRGFPARDISSVGTAGLGQSSQRQTSDNKPKKPEETKAVQKAEKPEEKKPVQKADKPEEKKAVQKADKKEEDKKTLQKADKPEEKKPAQKTGKQEEKKPVQKADKPEEKKPVQKQAEEEPREAESAQRAARDTAEDTGAMSEVAEQAVANKGSGDPLHPATRAPLESRMGADLGDVRVHQDPSAQQAASALNARAFTHGNDIWLGPGESQSNLPLMAHETTHVVQQSTGAQRQAIQRAKGKGSKGGGDAASQDAKGGTGAGDLTTGVINPTAKEITFDSLKVPNFKAKRYQKAGKPLKRPVNYKRGNPGQRDKWRKEIGVVEAKAELESKAKKDPGTPVNPYIFKAPANQVYFGDLEKISRAMATPYWDRDGKYNRYDVDHMLELQLSGENELSNMELLNSKINQKSGDDIRKNIEEKVNAFIKAQGDTYGDLPAIKRDYTLIFKEAKSDGGKDLEPKDHWERGEIEAGNHVKVPGVKPGNKGDLGDEDHLKVFPSESGGQAKTFTKGKVKPGKAEETWLKPFILESKSFDTETQDTKFGTLVFKIPPKDPHLKEATFSQTVTRVPGAQYAGTISKGSLLSNMRNIRAKLTSPIEFDDLELDEGGFAAKARIDPSETLPILSGVEIELGLDHGDINLAATIAAGNIKAPKPLKISGGSITLSLGVKAGLKLEGQLDFGIDKVGSGFIKGSVTGEGKLGFEGKFNFDSELFTKAEVGLKYEDKELSMSGELETEENKVKGIKKANITVDYAKEHLTAKGHATLTVPGVKEGTMQVDYSDADGLVIQGSFQLADNIPGISGGSIDAKVARKPDGAWSVAAKGEATPKIPGISAKVGVAYEDGIITIEGQVGYEKGMLKGQVLVGATNRPVDDKGQPGGTPSKEMRAYGGGSVTIRIAPWLQGTVGIKLLPNGEMEVSGEVALPSSIDLFPEKSIDKTIFDVHIDIPIVGLSAAGQNIGIFATIGGSLKASAGFGPGQLQEARLGVTYNPAHEEDTHVTGHAHLHIPAHAGLRLAVHGGLGVGIPVVSARAELEVGGELGLEGAVDTNLDVDWTPKKGLVLDAEGSITVEPKFKFDVSAFVTVDLDLLLTTINLYEKRWQLAKFEWGSGLKFGIAFPIHYEEGKPFEVHLSDVKFITPDVDVKSVIRGLLGLD